MPPKADTLLSLDRTLYNTWVTYMDFLKSPNSDPTVVADFLDRLADQPDEYLGYTNVPYLEWRTRWMTTRIGSVYLVTTCKIRDNSSLSLPGVEVFIDFPSARRAEQSLDLLATGRHDALYTAELFE